MTNNIKYFLVIFLLVTVASFAFDYSNCDLCHKSGGAAPAPPWGLSSSPHSGLSCTECHPGATKAHNDGTYSLDCSSCHEESAKMLSSSIHGGHKEINCASCHNSGHTVSKLTGDTSEPPHSIDKCADCHRDITDIYLKSVHGKAVIKDEEQAPGCVECHGSSHETVAVKNSSKLSPTKQPFFCASCHSEAADHWAKGVHGKINEDTGEFNSACVDCHTPHNEQPAYEWTSNTNYMNVAGNCGKCHSEEYRDFSASVHGSSVAAGVRQSPTCIDCHGSHVANATFSNNESVKMCGSCHDSPTLSANFGMSEDRVDTFKHSEHGKLLRQGKENTAVCIDCHTTHYILSTTDTNSALSEKNRVDTCSKCHEDAGERFSGSTKCIDDSDSNGIKPTDIVIYIYLFLIVSVIGGMVAHNGLDFISKAKNIRKSRNESPGITRLTVVERIQHILLLSSFSVLAFTGLSLKFSEWLIFSWLVKLEGPVELRLLIHKVAGVILIAVSLFHIGYLIFTRKGRSRFIAIFPRFKDVTDAFRFILHRLGWIKKAPEFDEFNYAEKAEYWALVWGNVIMGSTGFYMWFDSFISPYMPLWLYDVMRAVHFYEAILAVLAIIVWHIYFVVFDPFIYPMNFAWLDGRMSDEMLEHEKKAYYNKLKAIDAEQEKDVDNSEYSESEEENIE